MIDDTIILLTIAGLLSLVLYGFFRIDIKHEYTGISTLGAMVYFH